IYMPKKAFNNLNIQRQKEGEKLFVNPRNAAAGSVRQLDSKVTASRKLAFYAYSSSEEDGMGLSHSALLKRLAALGLPVCDETTVVHSEKGIFDFYQKLLKKRDKLPYDIDGMVIKVDDVILQKQL